MFLTALRNALFRPAPSGSPPTTVPRVDLARYAGRWYEAARLPNPEQDGRRRCVDVTATYTARPDGSVHVRNAARDANAGMRATGITGRARKVDDSGAKLVVRFYHLFGGAYWVIGLDPEYRWAVVGTPSRRRLWVLSRTPQMAPADYDRALAIARDQGYDPARIVATPQSGAA